MSVVKWVLIGLFTGFTGLVMGYTLEYFRPYKRVGIRLRKTG